MFKILFKCFAVLWAGVLFCGAALADQAAWISEAQSEKAAALLAGQTQLLLYCAPCSKDKPEIIQIETVEKRPVDHELYWELVVNDKSIDLAYAYYHTNGSWKNMALSLAIEVVEVPAELSEQRVTELSVIYEDHRKAIDLEHDQCLKGLIDDGRMAHCTEKAAVLWDHELNRVYQELMKNHLNEPGRQALKASQRQWIKQRDAELAFIEAMYRRPEFIGTMFTPMQAMDKLVVTKQRVDRLYGYLTLHKLEEL